MRRHLFLGLQLKGVCPSDTHWIDTVYERADFFVSLSPGEAEFLFTHIENWNQPSSANKCFIKSTRQAIDIAFLHALLGIFRVLLLVYTFLSPNFVSPTNNSRHFKWTILLEFEQATSHMYIWKKHLVFLPPQNLNVPRYVGWPETGWFFRLDADHAEPRLGPRLVPEVGGQGQALGL